jgi:hypothetical protein
MYRKSGPKVYGFAAASVLAAALILVACEREGPAERAGKKIDNATKQTGEAVKDAGKKIENAGK